MHRATAAAHHQCEVPWVVATLDRDQFESLNHARFHEAYNGDSRLHHIDLEPVGDLAHGSFGRFDIEFETACRKVNDIGLVTKSPHQYATVDASSGPGFDQGDGVLLG